jgi:thymidylate synthase (FAD)
MKIEYISHMGSDLTVVNAARVSMAKHKRKLDDSDKRLIKYLVDNNHISPLCHPQIQVRITAPIFVARQWMRSNVGCVRNETSRRYVDSAPSFYTPDTWRARPDGSIKQGSGAALDKLKQYRSNQAYEAAIHSAEAAYKALLEWGVAPEQARMVLPQSMFTEWVETGSLAYFARVWKLRIDAHAQGEIQELANLLDPIISPLFPISWAALTRGDAV